MSTVTVILKTINRLRKSAEGFGEAMECKGRNKITYEESNEVRFASENAAWFFTASHHLGKSVRLLYCYRVH